jgi:hypothetical protein
LVAIKLLNDEKSREENDAGKWTLLVLQLRNPALVIPA